MVTLSDLRMDEIILGMIRSRAMLSLMNVCPLVRATQRQTTGVSGW